jgi:xylulokinase
MIGGGVRNPVLCQALADMLGIPIERLESGEFATSLGAAVCAGVGVGVFDDYGIAAELSPIAGTDRPFAERKPTYDRAYDLFQRSYDALDPLFGDLVAMQREMADE